MSLQQKHKCCQNFIQQVLLPNNMPPNGPSPRQCPRYSQQCAREQQPSTPPAVLNPAPQQTGQKNSIDKSMQPSNGAEQTKRRGHWTQDQNRRYHWFLELHAKHFICKEKRRFDKIFKTMAFCVGTREAEQCRSHHQKMEKKYHHFGNILLFLRRNHLQTESVDVLEQDLLSNNMTIVDQLMTQKQLKQLTTKKSKNHSSGSSQNKNKNKVKLNKLKQKKLANIQMQKDVQYKNKAKTQLPKCTQPQNIQKPQAVALAPSCSISTPKTLHESPNFNLRRQEKKQLRKLQTKQNSLQIDIQNQKQKQLQLKKQKYIEGSLNFDNYLELECQIQNSLYRDHQKEESVFRCRDFLEEDYQHRLSFQHFLV